MLAKYVFFLLFFSMKRASDVLLEISARLDGFDCDFCECWLKQRKIQAVKTWTTFCGGLRVAFLMLPISLSVLTHFSPRGKLIDIRAMKQIH